jgi:hypothetical protein
LMAGQLPEAKPGKTKLVVVMAFDRGEDGELLPAFDPREAQSEHRAIRQAKDLATRHVGVIAFSRDADFKMGDYGPSVELYRHGDVPDLD